MWLKSKRSSAEYRIVLFNGFSVLGDHSGTFESEEAALEAAAELIRTRFAEHEDTSVSAYILDRDSAFVAGVSDTAVRQLRASVPTRRLAREHTRRPRTMATWNRQAAG
jgi:hypothetical protein